MASLTTQHVIFSGVLQFFLAKARKSNSEENSFLRLFRTPCAERVCLLIAYIYFLASSLFQRSYTHTTYTHLHVYMKYVRSSQRSMKCRWKKCVLYWEKREEADGWVKNEENFASCFFGRRRCLPTPYGKLNRIFSMWMLLLIIFPTHLLHSLSRYLLSTLT